MKKARLIAGMTAAIPAAVGGFAAPAAAHATQARTTTPAQQRPKTGKVVVHHGILPDTTGPQYAPLSESETLFKRNGGTSQLHDGDSVFVTCYYPGAPGSDPYWDHVTRERFGFIITSVIGHVADRHVDFSGAAHKYPFSVGIHRC